MINRNNIMIFDFETCNLRKDTSSPIQLAAIVLDPRKLEIIEGAEFNYLMKPPDDSLIEEKALAVNNITREQLSTALDQKIVWEMFVDFVKKYNRDGSIYGSVIPAGHNIIGFDIPILQSLAQHYGNIDNKTGSQNLISNVYALDLMQICFYWWENLKDPYKLKLTEIADFLGIDKSTIDGAHDALNDVKLTALILKRMMNFARNIGKKTQFKGAFSDRSTN